MRKIIITFFKFSLIFLAFILLYFIVAFCLSSITIEKEKDENQDISIYILTNGIHTDIVVPINSDVYNWQEKVLFSNTISKRSDFKYLAIGWGDKGFYLETPQWKDLKVSTAFNAISGFGSTLVHATFYKKMQINESCKEIKISKNQYKKLINYIENTFKKDENGNFINIKTSAVYSENDSFYQANGSYSIFNTFNSWANKALKECGQKACLWTPFDSGIFNKYK